MCEREEHPDIWFRLNAKYYVDKTRQTVADFVGADVQNVLLVSNATTAINTVVKCCPFKSGQAILDTSLTYGAVQNLCLDFTSRIRPDVQRVCLQLDFPIESEDYIIQKYKEILEQHPEIKLVILDHITSPTSILMPVKKLVDICHQHGAVVVIDGAHTIGHLPINVKELGADIYTSNLHKWAYAPRGSAFLWYDSKHAGWILPENTSWQMGLALDKQFFDQGTRDHISLICARHALQFYEAIGGMDKIVGYTSDLAKKAKEIFVKEVGLEDVLPESLEAPGLRSVRFPTLPKFPCSESNVWSLHKALFGNSNVFGIIYAISGAYYLRYSIQIYNDLDDVKAIAKVIKDFLDSNI
uniref:Aminotransferase class V domain-containing protein n=1 Tax=Arion vulgaris TaxID=1028688 RepID=A0A0B7B5C9_9EUPU